MILEAIVALTVLVTGNSCGAISNVPNKAVWGSPIVPITTTTYTDGGQFLFYKEYPSKPDITLAMVHAEDALTEGPPGAKVVIRCVTPTSPPYVIGGDGNHTHD